MALRANRPWTAAALALTLLLAACADRQPPAAPGAAGYKVGKPYRIDGVWYYPAVDYDYSETGIASWYGPGFHGKATANGEAYDMNQLTAAHRTLPMPSMVRVTNLENGRQLALRINDRGPFAHNRIIDVSRRAAQLLGFERKGTAKVRVEVMAEESRQLAALAGARSAAEPPTSAPQVAPARRPVAGASAQAAPTVRLETEALPSPSGAKVAPAAPVASGPSTRPAVRRMLAADPQPDGRISIVPVRQTDMFIQAGAFTSMSNAYRLRAKLATLGPSRIVPAIVGSQQFYRVRLGPIATLAEADQLLAQVVGAGHPEARLIVD